MMVLTVRVALLVSKENPYKWGGIIESEDFLTGAPVLIEQRHLEVNMHKVSSSSPTQPIYEEKRKLKSSSFSG